MPSIFGFTNSTFILRMFCFAHKSFNTLHLLMAKNNHLYHHRAHRLETIETQNYHSNISKKKLYLTSLPIVTFVFVPLLKTSSVPKFAIFGNCLKIISKFVSPS
jgi:hypothetical protein